ncbi:lipoyl(octanoyl) transferase LipB [Psychrobacter arenosus]|uniref:lipoyl(octanoyl) transferase LipB n=1 Tax=Psychrobacter arenosus TaxID=256326 RepID=UPI0019192336|nr:lipoyl(octanoyl) transferase LipB [Psychrobacter arenosus]
MTHASLSHAPLSSHPAHSISERLVTRNLPQADYVATHTAMSAEVLERLRLAKEDNVQTPDELWVVEHNDVYTLGQAGKESHILTRTNTPIIQTDRGGQVTWHGKGQLVLYWLFDLKTLGWSVRELVSHAEQAIEDVLNSYLESPDLCAQLSAPELAGMAYEYYAKARKDAPGVYIYSRPQQIDSTAQQTTINGHKDVKQTLAAPEIATDTDIMLGKIASLGFKIKHGMSYHGIALNLICDLDPFTAINPCGYAGMTMLRLCDFVQMDYQEVTDALVANIAARHRGEIALRVPASA